MTSHPDPRGRRRRHQRWLERHERITEETALESPWFQWRSWFRLTLVVSAIELMLHGLTRALRYFLNQR